MRKQRGGIMLFVLVMVGLMTTAILAAVQLGTASAVVQARREADAKAKYAVEGAIELYLCELRDKTKTLPTSTTYTVGAHSVTLTGIDNGTAIARTVKAEGTTKVQGRNYKFTRVVGNRANPNPFHYALYVDGNLDPLNSVVLGSGGANGDLCVNGSITARSNPFVINGDLECVGNTLPVGATITGNTLRGETSLGMPSVSSVNYLAVALVPLLGSTVNGYTFGAAGAHYPVVYRLGNLDMEGVIRGKGTIFVTGNVKIKDSVTYFDANSRLVVIALGDIIIDKSSATVNGFYFTADEFEPKSATTTTVNGAVVADEIDLQGNLVVNHDPVFWSFPDEGVKHRIPGMWP